MTKKYNLPEKIGDTIQLRTQGHTLTVKKHSRGTYFMRVEGEQRARWGDAQQAREDIAYFMETGALPRERSTWAKTDERKGVRDKQSNPVFRDLEEAKGAARSRVGEHGEQVIIETYSAADDDDVYLVWNAKDSKTKKAIFDGARVVGRIYKEILGKRCPPGEIERSSYTRKGYTRKDGTKVKKTRVPAVCIPDQGKPGKGPVIVPELREGKLGGPGYTDKSTTERHKILDKCVNKWGYKSCLGSLQYLLVVGKREMAAGKLKKIADDKRWLMNNYGKKGNPEECGPETEVRQLKNKLLK